MRSLQILTKNFVVKPVSIYFKNQCIKAIFSDHAIIKLDMKYTHTHTQINVKNPCN